MSEKEGKLAAGPQLNIDRTITNDLDRPVNGGVQDKYRDVRLRLGVVDNPTIVRKGEGRIDPINSNKIVNMSSGKIAIKWIEESGGIIRSPEFGKGDDDFSDREMLTLTHPILWADDTSWMGINYMPPVGSIVVIGFRKNGLPILLGFLQQHYQVMYPLELGEIGIKGFGQNYSHWKIHNEWETRSWVTKGQKILSSKTANNTWTYESAPSTVNLSIKIKASKDPKKPGDPYGMIELKASNPEEGTTIYSVKPSGAFISSSHDGDSSVFSVTPSEVRINSKNVYIN